MTLITISMLTLSTFISPAQTFLSYSRLEYNLPTLHLYLVILTETAELTCPGQNF